ncbi:BT_3987 domain-containing protein [Alistipes sp.]|uniref:BT_3987 domain-containing protein n=1 Tax=Alistipes sp. TaxID=1872444 RepID=UPI003A850BC3
MKRKNELRIRLRAAGLSLLGAAAVLLAGCEGEEFVRDGGEMPLPAGDTPTGALYVQGTYNPELTEYALDEERTVPVVYRLDFPAEEDVTVTLSVGTQEDVDAYNDAKGLVDITNQPNGGCDRYKLLPESNYALPASLTLTVPKGKTESEPLAVEILYDETLLNGRFGMMLQPWMLPLRVDRIEGAVAPLVKDQMLGIGIRPADYGFYISGEPVEMGMADAKKNSPFYGIAFADCRVINPQLVLNAYYSVFEFYKEKPTDRRCKTRNFQYWPFFDVECLRPLFIARDAATQDAALQADPDLMYVLTHQERYVDPQRRQGMKICVSIETQAKSAVGLCNLSAENRASLVWQIADFVKKYGLDGVALNDKGANYAAEGAPAVDKASFTKFLKALREALGPDRLILLSYDADEDSALYEAHDGLQAGEYLDYAWWSTENVKCTLGTGEAEVRPIIGLPTDRFSPLSVLTVDTPEYQNIIMEIGSMEAQEHYDAGEYRICVWLDIPAHRQDFTEGAAPGLCQNWGNLPLHEGNSKVEGLASQGDFEPNKLAYGSYFGGGLKDW